MSDVVLRTERLDVRPWRHEEAARLLDVLGRVEVVRWLDAGPPQPMRDLDEAHERIDRYHARSVGSGLGFWAVEVRETGLVAGSVLLLTLPESDGEVEVGWHLHPDSWGRGYAREAAGAAVRHGLDELGLPEVHAVTHLDNYPSQRVARGIGMHDLGVTTRWYAGPSRHFRARSRATRP